MATIPPDTRAVGTGNPPADMDNVADVLAQLTGMAPGSTLPAGFRLAPIAPSGDTTGVADTAAIQAALNASGAVKLAPGTFYANAPLQVSAGSELAGSGGSGPTIYDEWPFVGGTIIKAVAAWSGGANTAPAIIQANGTGVRMRDFWVDGSALWTGNTVTGATCDGVNDNTGFHSFCLRNVGVRMATNNGFTFNWGESVVFQCGANITWGDGFHGGFVDSQVINCFAQGCGLNGSGAGYAILASQCKFIGCRGDLSQYGFFISAYTGATNADMVQLIGCSTQRNNQDGVHISTPVANGTPILISGCAFDSDGVHGTLTTVSGGTPAGSGGYGSPGSGLGYAGISVGGGSTVILSGVTQTCGTGDASAPCPQYGLTTYAINTFNPVLVTVDNSFLNAGSTLIYDQTPAITVTGLNCYGYAGAVFNGQTPSHIPSVITGAGNVLAVTTNGSLTSAGAAVVNPTTGFMGVYDTGNSLYYGISRALPPPSGTSTLGGYYKGLGVGGTTSGATDPQFGVLASGQSGNGIGQTALTVYGGNKITTFNSTLDNGSGNMSLGGTLTPVSTLDFASGGRLLTGCKAATMAPAMCTATGAAPASGTLTVTSVMLQAGMVISNMLMCTDGTGETGGSHGWYVLMDLTRVVRAVTADQTGATAFGPGFVSIPLAFGASYTVPSTGRYLLGVCIVATGMPTFSGNGALRIAAPGSGGTFSPSWTGTSSTGQTTPPATGTTMGSLSNPGVSANYYIELS